MSVSDTNKNTEKKTNKYQLDESNILLIRELDIKDLKMNSEMFFNSLDGLANLKNGEKLMLEKDEKNNKVLLIDNSYYFQSVYRWYYGYNRHAIFCFLSNVIDDYIKFLKMLNTVYSCDKNSTDQKGDIFYDIYKKHNDFSVLCLQGLKYLKETYATNQEFDGLYQKMTNNLFLMK